MARKSSRQRLHDEVAMTAEERRQRWTDEAEIKVDVPSPEEILRFVRSIEVMTEGFSQAMTELAAHMRVTVARLEALNIDTDDDGEQSPPGIHLPYKIGERLHLRGGESLSGLDVPKGLVVVDDYMIRDQQPIWVRFYYPPHLNNPQKLGMAQLTLEDFQDMVVKDVS